MTEEEQIADGDRVKTFLNDPAIQRAFEQVQAKAFQSFTSSQSLKELEAPWSLVRALDSLKQELRVIADRGLVAKTERQRREAQEKPPVTRRRR